jgi:hypothetical protein
MNDLIEIDTGAIEIDCDTECDDMSEEDDG